MVKILNVHERDLSASHEQVAALMASLASADDRLWPRQWWPAMRFDRPLGAGAVGGHGPIRYTVESCAPGEAVILRFTAPRGFHGTHAYFIERLDPMHTRLRHVLEMRITDVALLTWPLQTSVKALPHLLTAIRLSLALPLAAALYRYDLLCVTVLLFLAGVTDLMDGWLARKLNICSTFGAYFDAAADFVLVAAAFGVLALRGVYPVWVLLLIVLMFAQFVLTSRRKQPMYDPVGKYFGAALYSAVFALTLLPDLLLSYALLAMLVMLSVLSLSARALWLKRTALTRKG
jgi:phosphatidylglycerophosphate synthase